MNDEEKIQDRPTPIAPIKCPHCKSQNLTFVSEYHKALILRIIRNVLIAIAAMLIILNTYFVIQDQLSDNKAYKYIDSWSEPSFVAVICILLMIGIGLTIFINITESKTHVRAICRDCGNVWIFY